MMMWLLRIANEAIFPQTWELHAVVYRVANGDMLSFGMSQTFACSLFYQGYLFTLRVQPDRSPANFRKYP